MISSYFANLYDTHKLKTKYNYFVEIHGKNICDDHFSMVSNIVERYEKGKGKIKDIVELNKILETDFENFRTGNIQNEVDLSPIQHQLDSSFNFSNIQEVLENIPSLFQLTTNDEFEYEEDNSDEEIQDITEIIESMVEYSSLLSNTSTEVNKVMENSNNLENSYQSFVIEIKHYKTILEQFTN
jgi:signal recognition particle GTPase